MIYAALLAIALLWAVHAVRRRLKRRRARRRYIPLAVRRFVLLRDGGRCVVCGSRDRIELDHIKPFCRGGKSVVHNLRCLCRTHNRRKGKKW